MLQTQNLLMVNEAIEKIYTLEDYKQMRIELLELLHALIPCEQSSCYLASKDKNHVVENPVGRGIEQVDLERYMDEHYEDVDYTRCIYTSGKSTIYRETDLFSDKVRCTTKYFKDIYKPYNIYYSLQMSIAYKGEFLMIISLYRNQESRNFNANEILVLNLLKTHLEHRAYAEKAKEQGKKRDILGKGFDGYYFVKKYGLTPREVEIVQLFLLGVKNQEILNRLNIAPNTLKKHTTNIYKKLNINNRWELINYKH